MNRTDVLFSKFIRARDGGCVMREYGEPYETWPSSDCWGDLQAAHILSRRFSSTRWDPENAVTLCAGHHDYYTRHPLAWNDWRLSYLGAARFAALLDRAYHGPKPAEPEIRKDLQRRLTGRRWQGASHIRGTTP